MAELADALALGASGRKAVQVRPLFRAPNEPNRKRRSRYLKVLLWVTADAFRNAIAPDASPEWVGCGARDRNRTDTFLSELGILSSGRLFSQTRAKSGFSLACQILSLPVFVHLCPSFPAEQP